MHVLFRKIFNVYPGEERRALLFALLGLTWSLAVNLGLQYSEALFLIHVGASALPQIYMISAAAMLLPALFLFRNVNRLAAATLFKGIIRLLITFYAVVYLLLLSGCGATVWIWYLLRVASFLLWGIMVTGYWTFTDQYHNMQDAKRLYVLFSSAIFAGLGCTGLTMRTALFTFEQIVIAVIALAALALLLVRSIDRKLHIAHDDSAKEEVEISLPMALTRFFGLLLHSPFALLIMVSNFMICLMWVTTEFNYLSVFDQVYDSEALITQNVGTQAPLILFLGECVAAVSISNLVFGLFFYSRITRRFGIGNMLLFSPTVIAFAFVGWMRFELLAFMLLAYFIVEGSLEVIDDSNFNLLLNAVPRRLKYRVRIAIESFLEPLAMLLGGLLLSIPHINSGVLALTAACTVLGLALWIQRSYHNAIYRTLAENAIHVERTISNWFQTMGKREQERERRSLYRYLYDSDPTYVLLAAEALLQLGERDDLGRILKIGCTLSEPDQVQLLALFNKMECERYPEVTRQLQCWLSDSKKGSTLQTQLLFTLAKQGLLSSDCLINDLNSSNLNVQAAAILTLKKGDQQLPARHHAQNRLRADRKIAQLLASADEDARITAIKLIAEDDEPQQLQLLLPYIGNSSLRVARHAMEAVAQRANSRDRHNAKVVIEWMQKNHDSAFRVAALKALERFNATALIRDILNASARFHQSERMYVKEMLTNMGKPAIPKLLAVAKESSLPHRCRSLAVEVLGVIALPYLHANLHQIVTVEIERAYFYFCHREWIQGDNPKLDLSLLVEAMQRGFHSVIEFIIHLLSSAGEVEGATFLCRLYKSGDSKQRGQVVETLEKTCDRAIFQALRPLIEEVAPEMLIEQALVSLDQCLTLEELLSVMSRSSSQVDQVVAATLCKQLQLPGWRDAITNQATHNRNAIFQHLAKELLKP